jgi:hypothetical protein
MPDEVDDGYSRLLADAEAAAAADAMAAAEARYAAVGLADRLRASVGATIAIRTSGCEEVVSGRLVAVADGAVAMVDDGRAEVWIVPFAAIASISGLAAGHRDPADRFERNRSIGGLLRPSVGSHVVAAVFGSAVGGRVQRVGSDHLQMALDGASTVVPFTAISWLRAPSHCAPRP